MKKAKKKVQKFGTGGLPLGSPEMDGGVKTRPDRPSDNSPNVIPSLTPFGGSPLGGVQSGGSAAGGLGQVNAGASTIGQAIQNASQALTGNSGIGLGGSGMRPEFKKGGKVKKMAAGGSASKRADGCAIRGKTKGQMV